MAHRTAQLAALAERPPASFPAELIPLLGVPDLATLTPDQAAGRACVWGGARLQLDTAIDLGETRHDGVRVFPQSCGPCVAERALLALAPHSIDCEPCHDRERWQDCPIGGGLHRLRVEALRLPRPGDAR
ncbi:hypothetical protein [Streptomyces sp. NBC_01171]|uniref:hypothetical protein n=1 Tax=Streptomyces sp. NBC_01171 TaxID=2903757 RepID=UPI00386C202B|nr:hypothetical protein OG448_15320 [Streptomyces sp. NBC_01171]